MRSRPDARAAYAAKRKARVCVRCGINRKYSQAWLAQGGQCAICQRHQHTLKKALAADHHAASGQFRALLCGNCNLAIGYFQENISVLTEAIAYLTRHPHGIDAPKTRTKTRKVLSKGRFDPVNAAGNR